MTMSTLHTNAASLERDHTKAQLVTIARARGWTGDPERAYTQTQNGAPIHQKETATIDLAKSRGMLATGKEALAYYIAGHMGRNPAMPAPRQTFEAKLTSSPGEPAMTPTATTGAATMPPTDNASKLAALIAEMTQAPAVDLATVQQLVNTASANLKEELLKAIDEKQPRIIQVQTGNTKIELEGVQHPMFEKVLKLVASGLNVMLTGAAGTGKTHLAEQVAKALGRKYGAIHCTAGASESQLMGWLLPSDGGKFEYQPAPFVDLYEQGNSIFLFDEMDAADPNFLLVANGALANGHIHIAQRRNNPSAKRGEKVGIMATTNTFGTGADMIYAGRNQLDGATLDRWYIVHIDYMTSLEAKIMGATAEPTKEWKPAPTDAESVKRDTLELFTFLINVRASATQSKLRRIISTRAFFKAQAARAIGIPLKEIKADLLAGWSKDELSKVGA